MEIAVLDFGGQYVKNIERTLLEKGVNVEIVDYRVSASLLLRKGVKGIVLSGGPYSVYDENPPTCDPQLFRSGIPVLGLCYGHQLIAHFHGGLVKKGRKGEYGFSELQLDNSNVLFHGLSSKEICWMSHGDVVEKLPKGFEVIASTPESEVAAYTLENRIYGLQFHPEVSHTPKGHIILENFAFKVCGCARAGWDIERFTVEAVEKVKKALGNARAVIAVSGGVDSSTAALLASRAIGGNLTAVHIDHGLMREGESVEVVSLLRRLGLNLVFVDASERFLSALEGVAESDRKRMIIGKLFIEEFEKVAQDVGAEWLIQGTIAPDVIESTRGGSRRADRGHGGLIKIHHNVAGLPSGMKLKLMEPLSQLFKYQVRKLARKLGLPAHISERQPFPGPGLACRVAGPVTAEKVALLRKINVEVEAELERYKPSQYFAMLVNNLKAGESKLGESIAEKHLGIHVKAHVLRDESVGVKGDRRVLGRIMTLEPEDHGVWDLASWINILRMQNEVTGSIDEVCRVVALLAWKNEGRFGVIARAVDTLDYMTAIPTYVDFNRLSRLGMSLLNQYGELGFFGFEVTTKPAATIELI
ncbi:MAG: glutamine-hydrolyzing GMP synthase [Thermoproteota archaeon]